MANYSKRAQALIAVLGDRPVAYHPKLAKPLGGPLEVIFVCQLLYWDGKGSSPGGWIYKTQDEWESETGMTRRNQETVRRHLKEIGVVEERLSGMPARLYYRLNFDKLLPLIEAAYDSDDPVCTDQPNKDGATEQTSMDEPDILDCADQPNMDGRSSQRSESTSETSNREYAEKKEGPGPLPVPVTPSPELWGQCLAELEASMGRQAFGRWLGGSRLLSFDPDGKRAQVGVSDEYAVGWCRDRLDKVIRRTLSGIGGIEVAVEYVIWDAPDPQPGVPPTPPPEPDAPPFTPHPAHRYEDTPTAQAEIADLRRRCVASGLSEPAAEGKGKRWLREWLAAKQPAGVTY